MEYLFNKTETYNVKQRNIPHHISSDVFKQKSVNIVPVGNYKKEAKPFEYFKNMGYAGALNKTNNDILKLRSYLGVPVKKENTSNNR